MIHYPADVTFVSYDGGFPNLCRGDFVVLLYDTQFTFKLSSGGSVSFNSNWSETVSSGFWSIDSDYIPDDFPKDLLPEVVQLANDHVPPGCCGGCV